MLPLNPQIHSKLVERLLPIWQQALGKPSIGIHDNFFELGGDREIAKRLFLEVSRFAPRLLPPVMIYLAPTVSSMAELLEHPEAAELAPAILLREGTHKPPVFISHGLGASVLDLVVLAKHIETDHAIYGLQAKGTEGNDEPLDNVEDMAAFHMEAIRRIQAHGPYILMGYSFGGLVMMEIAQRLTTAGETVELLGMVDTYPTRRVMKLVPYLQLTARLVKRKVQRRLGVLKPVDRVAPTPEVERQKVKCHTALERYEPRYYDGELHFLRAAEISDFPADPIPVWSHLVKNLHVETVSGNHLEMLDVHPEALAAALSRYLRSLG